MFSKNVHTFRLGFDLYYLVSSQDMHPRPIRMHASNRPAYKGCEPSCSCQRPLCSFDLADLPNTMRTSMIMCISAKPSNQGLPKLLYRMDHSK